MAGNKTVYVKCFSKIFGEEGEMLGRPLFIDWVAGGVTVKRDELFFHTQVEGIIFYIENTDLVHIGM